MENQDPEDPEAQGSSTKIFFPIFPLTGIIGKKTAMAKLSLKRNP